MASLPQKHEGNLLIDTLEALLKEPTLGNQTEKLKEALSLARLQNQVTDHLTVLANETQDKLQTTLLELENERTLNAGFLREKDGLNLLPFAIECHSNSVAHGWHDQSRTFGDIVALLHSEVSEALEAYRLPGDFRTRLFHLAPSPGLTERKPEGILSEFADVLIRILDYTESIKATTQFIEVVKMKHAYNKSRPFRHGGKQL